MTFERALSAFFRGEKFGLGLQGGPSELLVGFLCETRATTFDFLQFVRLHNFASIHPVDTCGALAAHRELQSSCLRITSSSRLALLASGEGQRVERLHSQKSSSRHSRHVFVNRFLHLRCGLLGPARRSAHWNRIHGAAR